MGSLLPSSQVPGTPASSKVEGFLKPLSIDAVRAHKLAQDLCHTFKGLATNSDDQFLATPISESILSRPAGGTHPGPHLAIDIGGTYLRVGFVELSHDGLQPGKGGEDGEEVRPLRRHLEHNWPIGEHLKNENAEALFAWIGARIAEVVQLGCQKLGLDKGGELPMGVTFSFPMDQEYIDRATLRAMGKGFAITSRVDLGLHLLKGYETARGGLPKIRIAAITNDAVATFVSFLYHTPTIERRSAIGKAGRIQRPAMGLICGTGSNATLLLPLSSLKESKRPKQVRVLSGVASDDVKIAVNTEWSINGSAPPLRTHAFISRWDEELSAAVENPGFQPLEYMTAGRYLGELGRIMFLDYLTSVEGIDRSILPTKLLTRFEPHNTTFMGHYRPNAEMGPSHLLYLLNQQFPLVGGRDENKPPLSAQNQPPLPLAPPPAGVGFSWTRDLADALYHIIRAIEFRAAGLIAAATVGLLKCSGVLPSETELESLEDDQQQVQLAVGYTGGCITQFQDYLEHCQQFLDQLVELEYPSGGKRSRVRIVLRPCHDGGIDGAGILVPAAIAGR